MPLLQVVAKRQSETIETSLRAMDVRLGALVRAASGAASASVNPDEGCCRLPAQGTGHTDGRGQGRLAAITERAQARRTVEESTRERAGTETLRRNFAAAITRSDVQSWAHAWMGSRPGRMVRESNAADLRMRYRDCAPHLGYYDPL